MRSPLEIDRVHVAYGDTPVVKGVSLKLEPGEIGCLLGPSGCGKTTLLRAIAGFEPLRRGSVVVDGRVISSTTTTLAPERRGVGMVFQDFALFPHLSVAANIGFGLSRLGREQRQARIDELLRLVDLPEVRDYYPHQLSGGQQQRIALARALAPRPALLLLDEPFSSMDVELRETLARQVRQILKRERTSALLVTHDQSEAFAMADRIAVMEHGMIRQWDSAYHLYHNPADRFVAGFIGQGVWLPVKRDAQGVLQSEFGPLTTRVGPSEAVTEMELLLRPDDVVKGGPGLEAEVVEKAFRGAEILYRLRLPSGVEVLYITKGHNDMQPGERLTVRLEMDVEVLFPLESMTPSGRM
ncbi:MAG: ABC transporter ATP-binding protein [Gammaproteobacteria bacterium]|nr:ABC transporter ATP-binding protein [Gammaproteobacteria bacterium]